MEIFEKLQEIAKAVSFVGPKKATRRGRHKVRSTNELHLKNRLDNAYAKKRAKRDFLKREKRKIRNMNQ